MTGTVVGSYVNFVDFQPKSHECMAFYFRSELKKKTHIQFFSPKFNFDMKGIVVDSVCSFVDFHFQQKSHEMFR